MDNEVYRKEISLNALHTIAVTAWENAALNHVQLFQKVCNNNLTVKFTVPDINLKPYQTFNYRFWDAAIC